MTVKIRTFTFITRKEILTKGIMELKGKFV